MFISDSRLVDGSTRTESAIPGHFVEVPITRKGPVAALDRRAREEGVVHARAFVPPAATAQQALDRALAGRLTRESWPVWRDAYVRIYHDDDVDREKEKRFYDQVRMFFRLLGGPGGVALPKEFAGDAMAWVALASTYNHLATEGISQLGRRRLSSRQKMPREGPSPWRRSRRRFWQQH